MRKENCPFEVLKHLSTLRVSLLAPTPPSSTGHPSFLARTMDLLLASLTVIKPQGLRGEADCMITRVNKSRDSGDRRWYPALVDPADSVTSRDLVEVTKVYYKPEKRVILSGSPPNMMMFFLIQERAITWSRSPALPSTSSWSRKRKPRLATLYCILTTITWILINTYQLN